MGRHRFSVSNLLFGTATQAHTDIIHGKFSRFHSLPEEEQRQLNLHTKVLIVTVRDLSNVHSAIFRLESASPLTAVVIRHLSLKVLQIAE